MAAKSRGEDPSASLPALAAQVADLRGIMMGVKSRLDHYGLDGKLDVAGQVAKLRKDLDAALDEGKIPAIAAPAWHRLSEDEHDQAAAELAGWVAGFLLPNYPHTPLLPCWPGHPALLWELSTLRAEWQRIYDRRHPELAGALAWHERWLPGCQTRIAAVLVDCKGDCALLRSPVPIRREPRPRAG
jgi:hypothetical protein